MGCDIHMIVQSRCRDGEWVTYNAAPLFESRSYSYFSMLAGVRDTWTVKTIKEPRGLPEGVVLDEDNNYLIGCDESKWLGEHSYSYLTLKEIKEYYNKSLSKIKRTDDDIESCKYYCQRLIEYLSCYSHIVKDDSSVRIVFGFDS